MKTIYSKLLLVSLGILLVGFVILTLGLNWTFKNYIIDQNEGEMLRHAVNFNDLINDKYKMGNLDVSSIRNELYRLERYADLKVWIVPLTGEMVMADESIDIDLIHRELNQSEINTVKETMTPIFREAKYTSFSQNQYYTLIFPVTLDDTLIFVMYLNKSVPLVAKTIKDINRFAFVTLMLASAYAAVTISFSAKRMSDEIKSLNNGVKFVAKGNFEYQFDTKRNDEMGELSRNFNFMTQELKNIEENRRKFISDLSHDLRSPITSIKGYTSGILDGTIPPEKWEKYLTIVMDETDRLTQLINNVLDLSRLQTGVMNLTKTDFDVHEILLNVLDRFEEQLLKKRIEVSMKLSDGTAMIEGDRSLVERLVYNLIDNAVKFVKEDGLLELMTEIKESKVLIGVRNTGDIIPEDQLNKIWNRFSKLDYSRGIEKKSSGLGLAIVKEIIDAHGEKIDVYSNEYLGVMFVFSMNRSTFSNKRKNS